MHVGQQMWANMLSACQGLMPVGCCMARGVVMHVVQKNVLHALHLSMPAMFAHMQINRTNEQSVLHAGYVYTET